MKKLTISVVAILALAMTAMLAASATSATAGGGPSAGAASKAKCKSKKCKRRRKHLHALANQPAGSTPSAPIAALIGPTTLTATQCPATNSPHGSTLTMSGKLSPDSGGTTITMTVQEGLGLSPTPHPVVTLADGSYTYSWTSDGQSPNLSAYARFAGDASRASAEVRCGYNSTA
jgi:hypothetical protein